jgi:hypothetical protein
VLGRPRALLHVDSTAAAIGFCVSIADVSPDGESHLVAKGMLNVTRRLSLSDPTPLESGEVAALDIPIDATAWRFDTGHRIRIAIASADFPNVWPTPERAQNGVHRGPAYPSRVVLPVVPPGGSADPPEFVPAPKGVAAFSSLPRPPTWEIVEDAFTGSTTVRAAFSTESRIDDQSVLAEEFLILDHVDPRNPRRSERARKAPLSAHTAEQRDRGPFGGNNPGFRHSLPHHHLPGGDGQRGAVFHKALDGEHSSRAAIGPRSGSPFTWCRGAGRGGTGCRAPPVAQNGDDGETARINFACLVSSRLESSLPAGS